MEIDQDIDQGVVVGDRRLVAQFGPLDAQGFGLTEDAFGGCALPVKPFVILTLTVELVTDTGAGRGAQGNDAAAFGPFSVVDGTGLIGRQRMNQRASITRLGLGDQAVMVHKGMLDRHG